MDIARRHVVIRLVLRIHAACRVVGISHVLVALYGALYFLRAALPAGRVRWLGTAVYPNEVKQLDDIEQVMGEGWQVARVQWRFSWNAFKAMMGFRRARTVLRLVRHLDRRYRFMPACRATVTLFLYLRFRRWLAAQPPKAVLVTSDYSPDGAALNSAASSAGVARIYSPHALPSLHIAGRNLLDYDLYLFDSEAMQARFASIAPLRGRVVYRGVRGGYLPMRLAGLEAAQPRIGIFLSSGANLPVLKALIAALGRLNPKVILVRGHPVEFSNPDFSQVGQLPGVKISQGTKLEEDVAACDVIIGGNSTVILESLRLGTPTAYHAGLDLIPYDYNGFVAEGLVRDIAPVEAFEIRALAAFFGAEWLASMRYFDAGYGQDAQVMAAALREQLAAFLGQAA